MRVVAHYRALLANGPLTRLLAGEFISAIGDWLYIVALLVVIYPETADPLLLEVFGDVGRHARSAVGVAALPLNAPVEIEMVLEVAD